MKIVQVIPSVHPSFGGPSVGAKELCRALQELGHQSVLIAASYVFDGRARPIQGQAGASWELAPSRPFVLQNSWPVAVRLAHEVKTADLVHIHGQYLLPMAYAYLIARLRSTPYGVQLHGGGEPYQRAQSRGRKALWNLVLGRRMLRGAKYVLFASESEAERAFDLVRPEQVIVEPLGARLSTSPVRPKTLTEDPDGRVFLFLGRLAKKKRPDLLIDAWAAASRKADDILLVAGPDEDWTVDSLTERARSKGCLSSIRFLGQVTADETSFLFRLADVFVLPSENENFGIAIAEALHGGSYVITTKQAAAHSFVLSSGAGAVLESPDFDALVQAIEDTANVDLSRASVEAREFALKNMTWSSLAQRLVLVASGG